MLFKGEGEKLNPRPGLATRDCILIFQSAVSKR